MRGAEITPKALPDIHPEFGRKFPFIPLPTPALHVPDGNEGTRQGAAGLLVRAAESTAKAVAWAAASDNASPEAARKASATASAQWYPLPINWVAFLSVFCLWLSDGVCRGRSHGLYLSIITIN